jgi:hypothetical protein
MSELDNSFAQLLGRQPTDKEKQDLYRVRDALKLKATDAVWLLLMALQHYETIYETFPARIAEAAREVTKTARETALAQAKAVGEKTKAALADAVREAAVASARRAAGAQLWKWVSVAVTVVTFSIVLTAWSEFNRGERTGFARGWATSAKRCESTAAAASWANTPEGKLGYGLAGAGSLRDLATCSGRGWIAKDGICFAQSEHGRVHGWRLPSEPAPP